MRFEQWVKNVKARLKVILAHHKREEVGISGELGLLFLDHLRTLHRSAIFSIQERLRRRVSAAEPRRDRQPAPRFLLPPSAGRRNCRFDLTTPRLMD
jgi:hypothetical protein